MSWNNVIPWDVATCLSRCDTAKASEDCPDYPLNNKKNNERTKNRQRNAEGPEELGGSEGST